MARTIDLILGVNNRRLKRELRGAQADIRAFGQSTAATLRSAFSAGVGGFAGYASISGLAGLGQGVLETEDALTRLGIQAGMSAGDLSAVRKAAKEMGTEFGLGSDKVVEAASAMADLEGASAVTGQAGIAKMRVLSQAAVATGADLTELAGVAFALKNAFLGADASAEDLEAALSAVIHAGKEGSVPLGEMSTVLQQIGTNFAKLSRGKSGAADLAAAIQIARRGFGSAGEVGTGIKAFVDQLEQNATKLKQFARVDVFRKTADGRKELRPLRELLDQIGASKIMKDPTLMTKVFGSTEARQFLQLMVANRAEFEKMAKEAQAANDVQTDAQKYLASSSGQLKVAIASARAELEEMVTPERIEKFVEVVSGDLVPALEWTLDHAKEIAFVFASIKLGGLVKSTAEWSIAMAGIVNKAGGVNAYLGKSNVSVTSVLLSLGKWAGPIGLAGTALWGVYKAVAATLEKTERITEEQVKQAELSKSRDLADKKIRYAQQLRADVEQSQRLVDDPEFEKRLRRAAEFKVDAKGGVIQNRKITKEQANEAIALRDKLDRDGDLSDSERKRLEAILQDAEMLQKGRDLYIGSYGRQNEAEAAKGHADGEAEKALKELRRGRPNFDPTGLDVRALASQKGFEGEGTRLFEQSFLERIQKHDSSLESFTTVDRNGKQSQRLFAVDRSFAVNDEGRIIKRNEEVGLASLRGAAVAVAQGSALLQQKMTEFSAWQQAAPVREVASAVVNSEFAQQISAAVRDGFNGVTVAIDGEKVFSVVQNTQATRRSPPG